LETTRYLSLYHLKKSSGTQKCTVFVDCVNKTAHGRHMSNEKAWRCTDLGHAGKKQNTQSRWKWNKH